MAGRYLLILCAVVHVASAQGAPDSEQQFFFRVPQNREEILTRPNGIGTLPLMNLGVSRRLGLPRVRVRITDARFKTVMDLGEFRLAKRESKDGDYVYLYAPVHAGLSELVLSFEGKTVTDYGEAGTLTIGQVSYEYHEGVTVPLKVVP